VIGIEIFKCCFSSVASIQNRRLIPSVSYEGAEEVLGDFFSDFRMASLGKGSFWEKPFYKPKRSRSKKNLIDCIE
jgi:hypothetical protein